MGTTITLKLLVDRNSNKVVYAEAQKDFVDFLFGLLELPLGTVLSLLVSGGMSGCGSLGKVYKSVKRLDQTYLQSDRTRNSLLKPDIVKLNNMSDRAKPTPLLEQLAYHSSSSSSRVEGHVKGAVTYIVMDDLTVKSTSSISVISVLNRMGVKDFGSLVEKNVLVDMKMGLKLLKASFESATVLSDVFLTTAHFPTSAKR